MIDKRFHKGIELKNSLLYFKGINHLPHITDIVHGYNTILEENNRLMKENQELRMSPRVDVNEIESLVCENEKLKQFIQELNRTIEVKELPEKGDNRLIYTVNGLEYIYFKGQWECIGKE